MKDVVWRIFCRGKVCHMDVSQSHVGTAVANGCAWMSRVDDDLVVCMACFTIPPFQWEKKISRDSSSNLSRVAPPRSLDFLHSYRTCVYSSH